MVDFLDAINRQRNDQRVAPLPFVLEREDEDDGLRCHLALAWTEATDEDVRSFVNTIPTRDGGTHELGMLRGGRHGRAAVHGDARPGQEGDGDQAARTSARG